nr:hypothetical protein [Mycobacterium tuberculosis]
MVVVGTDAHKYSHTFVATDEVGRQLGEKTGAQRGVRQPFRAPWVLMSTQHGQASRKED